MSNKYEIKNADEMLCDQMEDLTKKVRSAMWALHRTNDCIDDLGNEVKDFLESDVHYNLFPDLKSIKELSETLSEKLYSVINRCEEEQQ